VGGGDQPGGAKRARHQKRCDLQKRTLLLTGTIARRGGMKAAIRNAEKKKEGKGKKEGKSE